MKRLWLIPIVLLAAVAVAFAPSYPTKVSKRLFATNDLFGKPAPKLEVETWITPAPETKGKVVLIDFWATWCGPCREVIPKLNEWQEKFKDDLVIIGLSDEKPEVVREFKKKTPTKYASAIDTQRRTSKAVGIRGIPHVLLISPDGVVRWQGFPLSTEEPLTEEIIRQVIEASKAK